MPSAFPKAPPSVSEVRGKTQTDAHEAGAASSRQRPQPHLFVVLDREHPLAGGSRHSLANIEWVTLERGSVRRATRVVDNEKGLLRLRLPDPRVSAVHAELTLQAGAWSIHDRRSTNGVQVNGERVRDAALSDGDTIEIGNTFLRFRVGVSTPFDAPGDLDAADLRGLAAAFGTLHPGLARQLEDLGRVARTDMAILLHGETGTGKEVLARAIHAESRRTGPFIAVNCGALPQGLVESLLFGHKKGAFSGATADADGFVRAAERGTLLLDEIGDLPATSQATLLRVLQEHEVVPLGATRPVTVDVRVIAASHKSLPDLATAGAFREDLLARLAQFTHELPPLRERIDDLGPLIAVLLAKLGGERAGSLRLGVTSVRAMMAHRWPANVRELEQCLRVATVLARGDRLDVAIATTAAPSDQADGPAGKQPPLSPEDVALHDQLVQHLLEHRGNVTRVAEAMNTARRQVQRWVSRLRIDTERFRS